MRTSKNDLLSRKRQLHLRIGRSRRRINARLRGAKDDARRLVDWRTYAVRYPGWSAAAALGAGMAASTLLRPARIARWLGRSLFQQAFGGLQRQVWKELIRIWKTKNEE